MYGAVEAESLMSLYPEPQARGGFARSHAPYRGLIVAKSPVETRKFSKSVNNQHYKNGFLVNFFVQVKT